MKKVIIVILGFTLCVTNTSYAQVVSDQMLLHGDTVPATSTVIDLPIAEARSYYEEIMEDTYDLKVKGNGFLGNKDVLCSEEVNILSVSPKTIDLFASFVEISDTRTRVQLTARQGDDLYYSDTHEPKSYSSLQEVLRNFASEASAQYRQALLDEKNDLLKDTQKAQKKLTQSIKKSEDQIADNLKENEKLKKDVEKFKEELEANSKVLSGTKEKIEKLKEE